MIDVATGDSIGCNVECSELNNVVITAHGAHPLSLLIIAVQRVGIHAADYPSDL